MCRKDRRARAGNVSSCQRMNHPPPVSKRHKATSSRRALYWVPADITAFIYSRKYRMLQMSGKMPAALLPAEPLRLENGFFLEVGGSPDRIRKAHSVCFSFFLFFLAPLGCSYISLRPPWAPPRLPPHRASHSPSCLTLGDVASLLLSMPSLWEAGRPPASSLAPAPCCRHWQRLGQAPATQGNPAV